MELIVVALVLLHVPLLPEICCYVEVMNVLV